MRITIDTSDPLEHSLRVLGAVYDVQLTVAGHAEATASAPPDSDGSAVKLSGQAQRRGARANKTGSPRQRSRVGGKPDTATMRQWAREHGLQVPDRGRIPKEITRAYEATVTS